MDSINGSFWKGADGNVWVYGDQGTNNAGAWDDNTISYWTNKGYSQTPDPYAWESTANIDTSGVSGTNPHLISVGSGFGSGDSTPAADPIETWLLDEQIGMAQGQLGRIGSQRDIGLGNINKTYTDAETQRQNQFNQAKGKYDLQVGRNNQDYTNIRGGVRRDAGQQYTALQRLLGSAGAGRSSAAQILTPFAVGREAAQRFGQTQDTFARNSQDLDTSWNTTRSEAEAYAQKLKEEKQNQINALNAGLNEAEQGLNNQLYGLNLNKQQLLGGNLTNVQQAVSPYKTRIQELLSQIDGYGKLAVTPTKSIGFNAPELSNYNYSRFSTPTLQGQSRGAQDYVSPFVQLTNGQDDEERLRVQ